MNLMRWISGYPQKTTETLTETRTEAKPSAWQIREDELLKAFASIVKEPNPEAYEMIPNGVYPEESDEVWVEAYSGASGVRHDDLVGFVVLSDFREFLRNHSVHNFYSEPLKQGCRFPSGSSAFRFARRTHTTEDQ